MNGVSAMRDLSAAEPPQGANCYCSPSGGGEAARKITASVGALSAAGPSQGANYSPSGGSEAARRIAASVGADQ